MGVKVQSPDNNSRRANGKCILGFAFVLARPEDPDGVVPWFAVAGSAYSLPSVSPPLLPLSLSHPLSLSLSLSGRVCGMLPLSGPSTYADISLSHRNVRTSTYADKLRGVLVTPHHMRIHVRAIGFCMVVLWLCVSSTSSSPPLSVLVFVRQV